MYYSIWLPENKSCTFIFLISNLLITSLFKFIFLRSILIIHKPLRPSDIVDRSQVFILLNVLKVISIVHVVGGNNKKMVNASKIAG